jgi:uncharacterized protein
MALSPMTTTFEPDGNAGGFVINAYGDRYIAVNGQHQTTPFILTPALGPSPWQATAVDSLVAADFEAVAQLLPEVVLVGTGQRQRFLHPQILAPLLTQRIGVECMGLAAACRTYNILMAEGRKVVAAFLFE